MNDKKHKFHNDPARFFLHQEKLLTDEEKQQALKYSSTVFDAEKCPTCRLNYDLASRCPRILVHCGHTVCTSCLYYFFKDQRIRCPLCSKVIKRLRVIEVLPINHQIYYELITKIPESEVDPINAILKLPEELNREINESEEVELPLCEMHTDRYKHFLCMKHAVLLCRICITDNLHLCESNFLDLYLLRPELVRALIAKLFFSTQHN